MPCSLYVFVSSVLRFDRKFSHCKSAMEGVLVSEAPSRSAVRAGEGAEAGSSEAPSLRDLTAFVKSEAFFYSSEISTACCYLKSRVFNVVLKRRRIESECHDESDKTPVFRFVGTELLQASRALVACSTWTHAQFSFSSGWLLYPEDFVAGFEDLMYEVFSLLRSSPSLACFDVRNPWLCYKHLPTLLCENPHLEALIVHPGAIGAANFAVLAKTIALCFSRNSVLRSFTIQISSCDFKLNRESLEMLWRPFMTSEANATLKELVLHLPDFVDPDAIANLVRCNTTLERLELRFSNFRPRLRPGTCTDIARALGVNRTLKEFGCFCDREGLRELVASFDGRRPNTTLAALRLFLSHEVDDTRGQAFMDELVAILDDLGCMLASNTSLKHVQLTHDWGRVWRNLDEVMWSNRRLVEFGMQEKLSTMIGNELRANTSLESFAVGFWKLRRVGAEWRMSYGGPCLREQRKPIKEYIVKVNIQQ